MPEVEQPRFNPAAVELPNMARSLCAEAREFALKSLEESGSIQLTDEDSELLTWAFERGERDDMDSLEELLAPMMSLHKMKGDRDKLLDFSSQLTEADLIPDFLKDQPENVLELAMGRMLPIILLLLIHHVQTLEAGYLNNPSQDNYLEFSQDSNEALLSIHQMLFMLETVEPAAERLGNELQRAEGVRKGGISKGKRTEELKSTVLQEEREKHADKNASAAARAILNSLPQIYLSDDEGQPLLLDPAKRFSEWIRTDRKGR